ncbi:MAG: helix-turn-helix domain-containing protein [Ignavibacteriae bacterium]|nr:helix-turn-helix domain-containing protein [Ignavibacteriota bacterium]MCB9217147.1 helix-turn-helix domain-containing protein [Ignavibacteria bacterium]
MEIICLEETAFYALIEQVVLRLQELHGAKPDKWVNEAEAMRLLNIKSKTTLQEYRDRGKIRFSQPRKRIILYDRDSIDAFLEQHARETF